MLQIEPPPPTFVTRLRRPPGGRGELLAEHRLLQHAVQGAALEGPRREGGRAAQAHRPRAVQVVDRLGHALHEPRGRRARAGEPARAGHRDPPRPARGGALGQHARRRLHRAVARARASSRRARPTSGCRSASPPPSRGCATRRTSSSRATRPRTSSCPRAASPPCRTSIAKLQRGLRPGAGAADRDRGGAQAGARDAGARRGASTPLPQVATDPAVTALQHPDRGPRRSSSAGSAEKYKEGHPEVQKVKAQVEQLKKAQAGAGRPDPRRPRGRVRAAREARGGAARRDRLPEGAGREPEPQGHRARGAARRRPTRAKGLYEVLLQKLNETDIAASIRSNNVSVVDRASPPQYPVRPAEAPKIALAGPAPGARWPGSASCSARDYLAQHHPRPRGDRALPAPRPPGRGAALRGGERLARDRGLPEPAHGAPLRPAATSGGQVVLVTGTAPQEGKTTTIVNLAQAPRGLGREDGGGRLRPAARAAAPAARAAARAGLHRLLRAPRAGRRRCCGRPRSPTSSCSPRGRCRRTRRRSSRASSLGDAPRGAAGASSSGCSSTRRRSPPSPTRCCSRATPTTRCSSCSTTRWTRSW